MSEINLDDGKIMYEGEWYSADELSGIIQEKMDSGEMKFAGIAAALEELNHALEDSHTLEIKLVITKADYKKLKELGGDEDREAVRKAIMATIGADDPTGDKNVKSGPAKKKQMAIKCPQCKAPIKITSDERPLVVECPKCGANGRLTAQNKWAILDA
jgi:DNA-directed RNA polymerase subunit RPC12/RpoP